MIFEESEIMDIIAYRTSIYIDESNTRRFKYIYEFKNYEQARKCEGCIYVNKLLRRATFTMNVDDNCVVLETSDRDDDYADEILSHIKKF